MRVYVIFGTFNAKATDDFVRQKAGMFSGTIEVDEAGNFEGRLTDACGKSAIKGFTDEKQISFAKQYCDKNGDREARVINYLLFRREHITGWSGTWEDHDPKFPELPQSGLVWCTLFPGFEPLENRAGDTSVAAAQ